MVPTQEFFNRQTFFGHLSSILPVQGLAHIFKVISFGYNLRKYKDKLHSR